MKVLDADMVDSLRHTVEFDPVPADEVPPELGAEPGDYVIVPNVGYYRVEEP